MFSVLHFDNECEVSLSTYLPNLCYFLFFVSASSCICNGTKKRMNINFLTKKCFLFFWFSFHSSVFGFKNTEKKKKHKMCSYRSCSAFFVSASNGLLRHPFNIYFMFYQNQNMLLLKSA